MKQILVDFNLMVSSLAIELSSIPYLHATVLFFNLMILAKLPLL